MGEAEPGDFVVAKLGGYLAPSFVPRDGKLIQAVNPWTGQNTRKPSMDRPSTKAAQATRAPPPDREVRIYNARPLQRQAASEAEFFKEHGFVLLRHKTAVRDWDPYPSKPGSQSEIDRIYAKEVEGLIKTVLLPGEDVTFSRASLLQRGPSQQQNKFYGRGVHQDMGIDAAALEENLRCYAGHQAANEFRELFWGPSVRGYMGINFWRPCKMRGPVLQNHLAVCSAKSVKLEDLVVGGLTGFSPHGKHLVSNQLFARYNSEHRWYYYPAMTCDEVLVMRQFEDFKDVAKVHNTALHCAFVDPTGPEDSEPRENTEYRINVIFRHHASAL